MSEVVVEALSAAPRAREKTLSQAAPKAILPSDLSAEMKTREAHRPRVTTLT